MRMTVRHEASLVLERPSSDGESQSKLFRESHEKAMLRGHAVNPTEWLAGPETVEVCCVSLQRA